jgi:hypothetical protein
MGFNNLETIRNRSRWWSINKLEGNSFWVKETNDRLVVFISKEKMNADCRLYYSFLPSKIQYFLNSVIYMLFSETMVRAGLGLGARSLMVFEVMNHFVIDQKYLKEISFNKGMIWSRSIKSIFTECGIDPKSEIPISEQEPKPLPDRAELDKIVFDALGLTEEERREVYRAVCQLVWNRISKAKSV